MINVFQLVFYFHFQLKHAHSWDRAGHLPFSLISFFFFFSLFFLPILLLLILLFLLLPLTANHWFGLICCSLFFQDFHLFGFKAKSFWTTKHVRRHSSLFFELFTCSMFTNLASFKPWAYHFILVNSYKSKSTYNYSLNLSKK